MLAFQEGLCSMALFGAYVCVACFLLFKVTEVCSVNYNVFLTPKAECMRCAMWHHQEEGVRGTKIRWMNEVVGTLIRKGIKYVISKCYP